MSACLLAERAISRAEGAADIAAARRLIRAYTDWLSVDLCFQGVERELDELPGAYAPPRGRLLLARVGGEVVGCVGLRPLEGDVCEMKRLWVEPGFAGIGLGRALAERVVAEARALRYRAMRLDTLQPRLERAQRLYRSMGFREIPPYYDNPLPGVVMMELALDPPATEPNPVP